MKGEEKEQCLYMWTTQLGRGVAVQVTVKLPMCVPFPNSREKIMCDVYRRETKRPIVFLYFVIPVASLIYKK